MTHHISLITSARDAFSLTGEFLRGAALLVAVYSLALFAAGYTWSKMGVIRLVRPNAAPNDDYTSGAR